MESLGHVRFAVIGHDRGARVGYRLALDGPGRVERLALLDILPTAMMWEKIRAGEAAAPHWPFLARPAPEPEREIGRDPLAYFDGLLAKWSKDGTLGAFDPRALAAYRQSCNEPSRIHAFCEDYRAGAGVDAEQDAADLALHRTLTCPTLIVWSDLSRARRRDRDTAGGVAAQLRAGHPRSAGQYRPLRRRGGSGRRSRRAPGLPAFVTAPRPPPRRERPRLAALAAKNAFKSIAASLSARPP